MPGDRNRIALPSHAPFITMAAARARNRDSQFTVGGCVGVAALAHPDLIIEIVAVAALPD